MTTYRVTARAWCILDTRTCNINVFYPDAIDEPIHANWIMSFSTSNQCIIILVFYPVLSITRLLDVIGVIIDFKVYGVTNRITIHLYS